LSQVVIDGEKDEFQAVGDNPREKATLNGLPAEGHFCRSLAGLSKPCANPRRRRDYYRR
jgi:hypothetical protein